MRECIKTGDGIGKAYKEDEVQSSCFYKFINFEDKKLDYR